MTIPTTAYPHLTVATVIFKEGKYLLVKENDNGKEVLNQPAGHVEPGETIQQAAVRETLEETQWRVSLSHFLGISQYIAPSNGITYVRNSFIAEPLKLDLDIERDKDITDTIWLSYEEIVDARIHLRSPLVLYDIEKFRTGSKFDISLLDGFITNTVSPEV